MLPAGLPGLLIAGVLGSTMSVFSGGLNACATSIYIDIVDNALGWVGHRHAPPRLYLHPLRTPCELCLCAILVIVCGLRADCMPCAAG